MITPRMSRHAAVFALVLAATAMGAMSACGRTGVMTPGLARDAGLSTGGGGGGQSDSGGGSGQGGSTDVTSSGSPGGVSVSAGSSGQGGASSTNSPGGSKASAGSVAPSAGSLAASAGSSGQGGLTSLTTAGAGTSGRGGASSSGGSKGSGGQGGTVAPRVPTLHRPQASSCVGVFAPAEPAEPYAGSGCKKHADCTQGSNGRCIIDSLGIGRASRLYYCTYDQCATDADCDPGRVCYCSASSSAYCFYAGNCRTDADCGGGATGYCSPAYGGDCGGYHRFGGYYCHTPKDTCIEDRDCSGTDYCDYSVVNGRWECTPINMNCVIG